MARLPLAAHKGAKEEVGNITLKEVFHIAKAKSMDPQFIGVPLRAICISVIGTARSMGLEVEGVDG